MDLRAFDYYAALGVASSAERDELRRAWRGLVDRWHPDRAGPEALAIYRRIELAYAVLSDPLARRAYDTERRQGGSTTASRGGVASRPLVYHAPSVRLSRLSGPLNGLIARGVARWLDDEVIELSLTSEEAAIGGMVEISLPVPVQCPNRGQGVTQACTRCGGTGIVRDLFAAWLALRPGVSDGTLLTPSAWLPGMVHRVYFRVHCVGSLPH